MKKSDLILAQKTIAARQVKLESQFIREELKAQKATYTGTKRPTTSQQQQRYNDAANILNLSSSSPSPSGGYTNQQGFSSLPEIKSSNSPRVGSSDAFKKNESHLSQANEVLVEELAKRSITDQANARKKQILVQQSLQQSKSTTQSTSSLHGNNKNPNSNSHSKVDIFSNDRPPTTSNNQGNNTNPRRPSTTSSTKLDRTSVGGASTVDLSKSFTITEEEVSENFFMPKKKILRPDGATLLDIYLSKKDDTWGKIIKAQYLEDEERKILARRAKEKANEEYGLKLKQQLDEIHQQKLLNLSENNVFAQLENATAKRTEDLQKKRTEDAINRHKQFVSNALYDIGIKHHQREVELKEELTASTLMVNAARKLMAEEEEKRRRDKEYQRQYQAIVYQENLDNIAKKQKAKLDTFAEDRRIIAEREKQLERDRKRHEDEVNSRLQRSTEGPAHHIVQKIVEVKKVKDQELYATITKADNSLNKQLKASEDAAKQRYEQNGQSLTDEWIRNSELKAKKKKEDEERNNRIIATMHQMLKDQEREDILKREQQRAAQKRYQEELDAQLNELRQRSIDTLTKTMSEQEMKYNTSLIQKSAQYLK